MFSLCFAYRLYVSPVILFYMLCSVFKRLYVPHVFMFHMSSRLYAQIHSFLWFRSILYIAVFVLHRSSLCFEHRLSVSNIVFRCNISSLFYLCFYYLVHKMRLVHRGSGCKGLQRWKGGRIQRDPLIPIRIGTFYGAHSAERKPRTLGWELTIGEITKIGVCYINGTWCI